MTKFTLPWEWNDTYHENLHYKSLSLPPISTVNQTSRNFFSILKTSLKWLIKSYAPFINVKLQIIYANEGQLETTSLLTLTRVR